MNRATKEVEYSHSVANKYFSRHLRLGYNHSPKWPQIIHLFILAFVIRWCYFCWTHNCMAVFTEWQATYSIWWHRYGCKTDWRRFFHRFI